MLSRFARDHRWTPKRLSPYVDGELSRRARARLDRHVADCPECGGALHSLRRMLVRLEGVSPPVENPAPEAVAAAVRARLSDPASVPGDGTG